MTYTYKRLSYIKILLGLAILISIFLTVNVFSDEALGISFFLLGLWLLCWGLSYFAFRLLQYAMKQYHKYEHEKMAEAYNLALLFSCYIVTNVILIIIEKRTRLIGINLLLAFVIIQILLVYDRGEKDGK